MLFSTVTMPDEVIKNLKKDHSRYRDTVDDQIMVEDLNLGGINLTSQ